MRTKEIKVWVSPSDLGNKYFSVAHENADCPMKGDSVKARLIIELPEKKVEITESKFWEAINELKNEYGGISGPDMLAKKLFGEGSEG